MSDYPDDRYDPNLDDTGQQSSTQPINPVTPPQGTRRVAVPQTSADDQEDYIPPTPRPTAGPRQPQARPAPSQNASRSRQAIPPPPSGGYSGSGYYPPPPDPTQYPYASAPRRARQRRDSGMYLPWWSLLVMLAVVGGLSLGAFLVVNTMGGQAIPGGATPLVVVITATFTVGPPATESPIPVKPTLTPTHALPTIAPTASLPPGDVAIGATIQIVGVGGSGLNVRSGPGKQFTAKFLAQEGEKYTVKDGPQTASDEEWWLIEDPANPNNAGWAARRFLQVVQ